MITIYRKELEFGLGRIVDLANYCSGMTVVQSRGMRRRKFASIHDKGFLNYCGWLHEEGYLRGVVIELSLRRNAVHDIEERIKRPLNGALCSFGFVNDNTDKTLLHFETRCTVVDNGVLRLSVE